MLVFLSGEREIHDVADALRDERREGLEVLPLYARLSAPEQHRIFQPHRGRRVVLATNVAETSITVPGVRYVVDAGIARISRYSRRLKVQRLPIEPVSQASANQRAGRCGRVAPGVCIRLFTEDDYDARPEFTEPEILRTNLASVILQMTAIGLGDVARFPFVEAPDSSAIRDGDLLLDELGAVRRRREGERELTKTGRQLARLPIDPRLGRMIVEADRLGCVREVLVIASALSIQDVRERPREHPERAAEMHNRFRVDGSDLLSIVAVWDYLRDRQRELSGNQFRRMCREEFLHYLRVREWRDLYSQLRQIAGQLGIRPSVDEAHPDHVHRAVLAGLLTQIGVRDGDGREYRGARDARFVIAPGSVLTKRPPRWVMAAELVETDRLRAAARGDDPTGVGRADRRPPGQALVRRAVVGRESGPCPDRRDGHALRPPDRGQSHGRARPGRSEPRPGAVHPSRARGGGVGAASRVRRRERAVHGQGRAARVARPAPATWSTTRRSSASSTTGFPTTSRRPATSTGGGVTSALAHRSCSSSTTRCSAIAAGSGSRTSRAPGEPATRPNPITYRFDPTSALDGASITVPVRELNQFDASGTDLARTRPSP